jgi:hypothetical protein
MHTKSYKDILKFSRDDAGKARIHIKAGVDWDELKKTWNAPASPVAQGEVPITEVMGELGISRTTMHTDIKSLQQNLLRELDDEHFLGSSTLKQAFIEQHLFGTRKMEDGKPKLHFTPAGAELARDFIAAPDKYKELRWARVRGENQEPVKVKPPKASVLDDVPVQTSTPAKKEPRPPKASPAEVLEKPYDFSALNAAFGIRTPAVGDVNPHTLESGAVEHIKGKNQGQGKA